LKGEYKLILIDVRGHGVSGKPHDPNAYKLELLVNDVIKVLDDLGINKAHFLGFSMGGWIGFGIGKYAPERFHSLIINSMSPYRAPDEPNELLEFFKKGPDFTWTYLEENYGPKIMMPRLKARWMANDTEALIALLSKDWMLDLGYVLPKVTLPSLLLVGEADPYYLGAKKCVANMPSATFVSFPNLKHLETFYRSDLVIPYIKKFLSEVPQL
jgi:pimeloyl-ACP methyl ester carboxylesterase